MWKKNPGCKRWILSSVLIINNCSCCIIKRKKKNPCGQRWANTFECMEKADFVFYTKCFVSIAFNFRKTQKGLKNKTPGASKCPCMLMTLEGDGTISQLNNAPLERSCVIQGHAHFNKYKTKRQTLNWFCGRVIKINETCLSSKNRVVRTKAWIVQLIVQLKETTVHIWAAWENLKGPCLLVTIDRNIVEDSATASTQMAVFISFILS